MINIEYLNSDENDNLETKKIKKAFSLIFNVYLNYLSCRPIDFEIKEYDDDTINKMKEHIAPIDNDFKCLLQDLNKNKILSYPSMDEIVTIPVIGKVSAGLPLLAEENIEGYEFAPSSRLNSDGQYFYLIVNGDSMNRLFDNGSRVLVQKQSDLENGDIGVIRVNGDDATVKRFKKEGK